jgi:hypothetical protein
VTIFDLLAAKQEAIEALFRRTHDAANAGDTERARSVFGELSALLVGVMRAEHAVVYPVFVYSAGLAHEVSQALRDHREIEDAVNHIRLSGLEPEAWAGAVVRLHGHVAMHLDLEELVMFPVARLRLTNEEMRKLAEDFIAAEPRTHAVAGASITYEPSVRTEARTVRERHV